MFVGPTDTLYQIGSRWRPPFRVVVGGRLPADIPTAQSIVNREIEMALKRPAGTPVAGTPIIRLEECQFALLAPTLWEWLVNDRWDDGSPRTPGSITIFTGDGLFKSVVKDKDASACLWCAAPSLEKLLGVVEASLTSPTAEWRADRTKPGDVAKRLPRKG